MERLFARVAGLFRMGECLLAFARDDFFAPDFLAPERIVFSGRTDLTMRFAAGTATRAVFTAAFIAPAACRAVRLTAGIIGLPLSARFPTIAPTTPPRTAPTGPPTAPRTAPVAAPASDFEIGGMLMFLFDVERLLVLDLFLSGILRYRMGALGWAHDGAECWRTTYQIRGRAMTFCTGCNLRSEIVISV